MNLVFLSITFPMFFLLEHLRHLFTFKEIINTYLFSAIFCYTIFLFFPPFAIFLLLKTTLLTFFSTGLVFSNSCSFFFSGKLRMSPSILNDSPIILSASQDEGIRRNASLLHTTKRRITTNLKTKENPELPENQTLWKSDNPVVK